jgi:hypothetical protein
VLSWQPPAIPNGVVQSYTLSLLSPGSEDVPQDLGSTTALTFSVTSLTPYTMYTVIVAAITRAGQGPWSNISFYTLARRPSDSPGNVSASALK